MSERHQHEAAAEANVQVARRLQASSDSHDRCWVVTVVFYAVVQLVDARLADDWEHPDGHPNREIAISGTWNQDVRTKYGQLRRASELWRYHGRAPTSDDIDRAWRWAEEIATAIGEKWPSTELPT